MSVIDSVRDEPTEAFGLPLLYNLVYCSRAVDGMDEAGVGRILSVAQRCNPVNGITGLLVYGGGIFFQWLEGPRSRVTQLMANITRDARHDTIISLTESEEVRERLFPDWAMERVTTEDIRDVLEDALDTAENENQVRALRQLLEKIDSSGLAD